jgi:hypothetical protein
VIRRITAEHDTHLKNALVPAADADDEISLLLQRLIDGYTPYKARALRRETFKTVLQELVAAGKIDSSTGQELVDVVDE